jgi:acyl transferase domain-containing protein
MPDREPVRWIVGALERLGVAVRVRVDPEASDPVALEHGSQRIPLFTAEPTPPVETFLGAVAALYRTGVDLRLAPLRAPGAGLVGDLPTYPFQRKRFWIDEPVETATATATVTRISPDTERGAHRDAHDGTDPAAVHEDVAGFLRSEIAAVLRADGEPDLRLTFGELGGDSFTAMLFIKSVEDRYDVDDLTEGFAVDQPLAELLELMARQIDAARPHAERTAA